MKKHRKKPYQNVCQFNLCADSTMTQVFTHFDICPTVSSDDKMLLGDKLGEKLQTRGFRLPTTGSFTSAYSKLSHEIHTSDILKDDIIGRIIVSYDLDLPLKRFLGAVSLI